MQTMTRYLFVKYAFWGLCVAMLGGGVASVVQSRDMFAITFLPQSDREIDTSYTLVDPIQVQSDVASVSEPVLVVQDKKVILTTSQKITEDTIIGKINQERVRGGKMALAKNTDLSESARRKAEQIIKTGYFEHVAKDGTTVSDLAESVGYVYASLGENLALGTFATTEDVVDAWIGSPAHKENVFSDTFNETGVGVVYGVYRGVAVVVLVQHFGRQLSDCRPPDSGFELFVSTRTHILEQEREQILKNEQIVKKTLNPIQYEKSLKELRAQMQEYTKQTEALKEKVEEYNRTVQFFNTCVQEGSTE
jgi:uncharacterized protein YkwD